MITFPSNPDIQPGHGVTLVFIITYPKKRGPSHTHREWGHTEEEARQRMETYVASLPHGCKATQIERRIGR